MIATQRMIALDKANVTLARKRYEKLHGTLRKLEKKYSYKCL